MNSIIIHLSFRVVHFLLSGFLTFI